MWRTFKAEIKVRGIGMLGLQAQNGVTWIAPGELFAPVQLEEAKGWVAG
jgi:hypothetical protein